jgi:hypothetical protein
MEREGSWHKRYSMSSDWTLGVQLSHSVMAMHKICAIPQGCECLEHLTHATRLDTGWREGRDKYEHRTSRTYRAGCGMIVTFHSMLNSCSGVSD